MVSVIGGGLAGSEAAYALAQAGIKVDLYEMRPKKMTEAHTTGLFGELVCSTSLKSTDLETAHGLLKNEMKTFDSLVLKAGEYAKVPGGGALCVDKKMFSQYITDTLINHENINVINEEIKKFPKGYVVVATGPLTSSNFVNYLIKELSSDRLYFFDAIAPSVTEESIDYSKVFRQSRYDKGDADYINCPFTQEEYYTFLNELLNAKKTNLHLDSEKDIEKNVYYEGCLPVEVMASRGVETLTFGMMKPRGLTDPHTGERPYAVVQLRQENKEGTIYGLVGFQTQLTIGEQKRVFRMIPGLENCEFARFGEVHRNTYIKSPDFLNKYLQYKKNSNIFFAGQIIGVEGYMESSAMGIVAGHNLARLINGKEMLDFPQGTMIGSLINHVTEATENFQPSNSNFGILSVGIVKGKKRDRKIKKSQISQEIFKNFIENLK